MLSAKKVRLFLVALWCGLLLGPALAVDERLQVEMLRAIFNQPHSEWPGLLRESSGLIDQTFFERVDARIRWSSDNNLLDDAIRFSMVGDFACDAVNRVGGYRLGLAMAFQKSGNDEMARSLIDNILLTHPNSAEARYLRAGYRRAELDLGGAIEDYENLFNRSFQAADCAYYLASIYETLQKPGEAQRWLDRGLQAKADHPGLVNLRDKYKSVPRPDGPNMFNDIPLVIQPRQVDPKKHADYFRRAEDLVRKGKLVEAELSYKDALSADRNQSSYWIYFGALQYRLGRLETATAALQQGLKINPKSIEGWRFLGCSYERLFDRNKSGNDLEAAKQSFSKAVELVPGDPIAQMGLERLQVKRAIPSH